MRSILNISLPEEMSKEIEKEVKKGNYSSKSEFIRDLVREWQKQKVLAGLKQSKKEFAEGRGEVLTSLRDLRS